MATPRSADAAQHLVEALSGRGQKIAVAESLTGGLASLRLTQTDGAADVFAGGIVCYQTVAKHHLLDVSPGPVISRRCAVDMADGVAARFGCDVAVAFTGVAGPDTQEQQPVGTVWLAWTVGGLTDAVCLHLPDSEPDQVREQATAAGFDLVSAALGGSTQNTVAS